MSKCIVCNKRISKGDYFCDECLKEEIGEPPKQRMFGLLSWLVHLPFQVQVIRFGTHWTSDEERLQWTAQRVDRITDRWPQIPTEQVVDRICMRAGLEGPMARTQVLTALQSIKEKKNSPLWAPWDIVFQPGIQILIIAVGLLGLFLLASSL
jgi:predicted nucleic acid-binding Zn ribbon protein